MSVDDYTRLRLSWLDQVFEDEALSKSAATNVAFFISKHFNRQRFNDSGIFSAWPSYATLAEKVGCTERTVQSAVRLLAKRGHLKTKGKGGRNCTLTYFAVLKRSEQQEQPEILAEKGGNTFPRFVQDDEIDAAKGGNPTSETWKSDGAKGRSQFPTNSLNKSLNEPFELGARAEAEITPLPQQPAEEQKVRDEGSRLHSHNITPASAAVAVLSALIKGPGPLPPPPPIVRRDPRPEWLMDHQANHGWPNVYENLGNPEHWAEAFDDLAYEMEPVAASKDNRLWREWAAVYRKRGWPLPPAQDQLVHFPDCGPKGFDGFLARLDAALREEAISEAGNVLRIAAR
ncbi:helix-turn-helix domain-containing protein [Martelella lutilitoris]|uniref:Helix-turn-helix domain-containing protein n=1 Tax=Martelella lutilitoris TaxID=2583532 RepID=A0A7T7HMI9_9HYPH|nr:helix-turn-helix domain-containing protein [Martelella lutilitoris]QQM31976.1 helix-turn-helix domain-containing protein [Martelella lutilitoris]